MKKILFFVLFLVFVLFALTLNIKNPGDISLSYYFGIQHDVPLYIVLLAPFAIGMILGVALTSFSVLRNKMQLGKTKRELTKVEKELQNLRSAPITEPMKDEIAS